MRCKIIGRCLMSVAGLFVLSVFWHTGELKSLAITGFLVLLAVTLNAAWFIGLTLALPNEDTET